MKDIQLGYGQHVFHNRVKHSIKPLQSGRTFIFCFHTNESFWATLWGLQQGTRGADGWLQDKTKMFYAIKWALYHFTSSKTSSEFQESLLLCALPPAWNTKQGRECQCYCTASVGNLQRNGCFKNWVLYGASYWIEHVRMSMLFPVTYVCTLYFPIVHYASKPFVHNINTALVLI